AFLLHKLALGNPSAISPMEALEMATVRGAKLYGLENELGSIEPGKLADIIIIDPKRAPTPVRSESVVGHIINSVDGCDVETVIVGGNILMRERKMLSMEEEEAIRVSRKSAEKLWQKMGAIKKR
ncbi:MAG: amidohydrolase family protein, partial [Methanobacteriota archaeon]